MSKFALWVFAICLFSACTSDIQESNVTAVEVKQEDYSRWRTGKFYYKDPTVGAMLINRTDSFQEEFVKSSGLIVKFDINWLNDTMYTLAYDTLVDNPNNMEMPSDIKSLIKTCTIIKTAPKKYKEKSTSNLTDRVTTTTIYSSQ